MMIGAYGLHASIATPTSSRLHPSVVTSIKYDDIANKPRTSSRLHLLAHPASAKHIGRTLQNPDRKPEKTIKKPKTPGK